MASPSIGSNTSPTSSTEDGDAILYKKSGYTSDSGSESLNANEGQVRHARSGVIRRARHPVRGPRGANNRRPDGRDHQPAGDVHLRFGSLALPRRLAVSSGYADG